jgi:platelet-activating factor acetylhydrolase
MRISSTSSVRGDGGGGTGIFYDPRPHGGGGTGIFYDPRPLVVGDAPLVGIIDFPATVDRPPVRLYYPAEESSSSSSSGENRRLISPARYFSGNRFAYFLLGYAHVAFARHTTWFHMYLLRPLLWFFSFLAPIRYMKIPYTAHVTDVNDAMALNYIPPSSLRMRMAMSSGDEKKDDGDDNDVMQKQKLVLFSHGLTGTGEENSIFCSSLAKRGYVVASIHHRDGSSNQVPLHDGSRLYYKHFPSGDAFDPRDRLQQVQIRAKEMLQCRSWLVDGPGGTSDDGDDVEYRRIVLDQIRPHLDYEGDNAIAAGFSYGSTTAVLAATLEPNKFCCVLLLDPWLHIDYQSKGIAYDFPPEAFGQSWPQWPPSEDDVTKTMSDSSQKKEGLKIPSLIISSSMFAGYEKLKGAMLRLADQTNSNADVHVIPNTAHQNFCDVAFWVPKRLLRGFIRLGDANAYDVHEEILDRTVRFLRRF